MSDISLLISNVPLRESVAEAIKNARFGDPKILTSLQEAADKPKVLIIDKADYYSQSDLQNKSLSEGIYPSVILLLGDKDDTAAVSETFCKPFRLGHLLSRLRYYLETAPLLRDCEIFFGPYSLEPQHRRIWRATETDPIRLTEKETALLVLLTQRPEPLTRADILAEVWGYDGRIDTHTLETHLYQLRRKLDRNGENWIVNDAGTYRLAGRPK